MFALLRSLRLCQAGLLFLGGSALLCVELLASYPGDNGRVFEWIELSREGEAWSGQITILGAGDRQAVPLRIADRQADRLIAGMGEGAGRVELALDVVERGEGELVLSGSRASGGGEAPYWAEHDARVEIRSSAIHGHGVFAKRDLAAGDVITAIRGEQTVVQTPHSARITETVHCEPTGYLRYINHCCDANSVIDAADPAHPVLRASRAIAAGDEVNFDYIENEGEIVGGFACNCGAAVHHI